MDGLRRMTKGKIPGEMTGIEIRKSICTLCDPSTQCGLDCYVRDGRILKVEGTLENPMSGGTLCAKGAAQRQWVYHEERLRTPMRRIGARGSNDFVPISWTEALSTIASEVGRFREEGRPESVVFYCGYPKHFRPFLMRLALLYGSPNWCTESSTCFTAMQMAWRLTYGRMAPPDLVNTKCALVWSGNPFHSSTPNARLFFDARNRGVKFILVDPRVSPVAPLADIHLQLRPGTDGALALAMANTIISEGLYDRRFCAEWAHGFDEFKEYAAEFQLARAEEITGVPAAKIRDAAILYATTRPAAMLPSPTAVVHHTNGVQNQRAALALVGLTGNYDIPGGNVPQQFSWLEISGGGFITREHEFEQARPWTEMPPRMGAERFPVWTEMVHQAQAMDLPRQILSAEPYPLRALVAFGMNHRMWPDSNGLLAALQKLDFIVDVDLFMTDTAKHADIVLPACSSVERSELRCYPQKHVIFTTPVIEPLGESRSDTDIIFALADVLGIHDYQPASGRVAGAGETAGAATDTGVPRSCYLPNGAPDFGAAVESTLDWILEPSGMKIQEIKKHPGGMPVPNPILPSYRRYEKDGFPTPSGKMEFASSILAKHAGRQGISALPLYSEDGYSPVSAREQAKDYPFILGTGTRLPMFIHSRTFRLPWTRALRPDPMADINPADASRLGIGQGDVIEISTPAGRIRVGANVTELAYPGAVHMFHDYPEANANLLLEGDYLDPISGFPGFKGLLCAVRRVTPYPIAEEEAAE